MATEGSPENGGANGAAAGVKRKASDEPDVPAKAARADGDVTPLSAAAAAAALAATPLAVERVDSLSGFGEGDEGMEASPAPSGVAAPAPRGKIKLTLS